MFKEKNDGHEKVEFIYFKNVIVTNVRKALCSVQVGERIKQSISLRVYVVAKLEG